METELQVGRPLRRRADAEPPRCQPDRCFLRRTLSGRCLHGSFQRLSVARGSTACWRSSWRSCTTSHSKSSAHSGCPSGLPAAMPCASAAPCGAARLRSPPCCSGNACSRAHERWASLRAQRGGAARCRTLNQRVQRLRMEGAQAQARPEAEELAEIKADSTSLLQKIHVGPSRPAPPTRPLKTTRTCHALWGCARVSCMQPHVISVASLPARTGVGTSLRAE